MQDKLAILNKTEINNTDILNPLDQFEINNLFQINLLENTINISFTNIVLYLTIGSFITIFFNVLANKYEKNIFNF